MPYDGLSRVARPQIDQYSEARVTATRLVTKIWKAIVPETRTAVTIMNDKSKYRTRPLLIAEVGFVIWNRDLNSRSASLDSGRLARAHATWAEGEDIFPDLCEIL